MAYQGTALWREPEGPCLRNFNEGKAVDSVNGALALRPQIEQIVDQLWEEGFDGIWYMGIGGTWASALQAEVYLRGKTALPVYAENAAEFLTTGNRRFTSRSVLVYSSVSGNTKEMVELVDKVKALGARVVAFIDTPGSALTQPGKWDYLICYPQNEQLKFYMVANYLLYKNGEFPDYDQYNREMEAHLAQDLADIEKECDAWAYDYAKKKAAFAKEHPDLPHYFIGAGNQYGATYSYAMCYWEEQLWLRTKSISCGEFFHGMQEIIVADTPVTLFLGEDELPGAVFAPPPVHPAVLPAVRLLRFIIKTSQKRPGHGPGLLLWRQTAVTGETPAASFAGTALRQGRGDAFFPKSS